MGGYFYSGLGYFMTFWDDPTCIQTGAVRFAWQAVGFYPQGISTPGAVREIFYCTVAAVRPRSHPGVRWACTSRMTGKFSRG